MKQSGAESHEKGIDRSSSRELGFASQPRKRLDACLACSPLQDAARDRTGEQCRPHRGAHGLSHAVLAWLQSSRMSFGAMLELGHCGASL